MRPSAAIRVMLQLPILALALAALTTPTRAQCPLPDRLDGGPCCTKAKEKLPPFPDFVQNSLDICWANCNAAAVGNCRAQWTIDPVNQLPNQVCGMRKATLQLFDAFGNLKWSGSFKLIYARTWQETDPSGSVLQVWRFLVNGDLRPTAAAGLVPCPVPPCAAAFGGRVMHTGYIDWAYDCAAGTFSNAWMLTHACDVASHVPGLPRGGAFHPGRAYSFVGPAAGFAPAAVVPAEGTVGSPFETVRRVCEFEERIFHTLTPFANLCACSGAAAPAQWQISNVTGVGACGTTLATPAGPLPGFMSMGLGAWTVAGTYPGLETLRWNLASYNVTDPCTGVLAPEAYYGVTTLGGYPGNQITSAGAGLALPPTYIDQVNSKRAGALVLNVPFQTDRVLNLNH